jgi:uncharacterized RDD family membrane protein YckC
MTDNFYAAPQAELGVPPPFGSDVAARKATRGSRLAATFVDGLAVAVPVFVGAMFAGVRRVNEGLSPAWPVLLIIGGSLLAIMIVNIVLLARDGQTLGKKALGIAIVRTDGSQCELWRILVLRIIAVRLITAIPFVGMLFALADILVIFGEERRCVHDYMADTIVVTI